MSNNSVDIVSDPSNEKIKYTLNVDKFKVCSLSLFRPYIRNKKYKSYYYGMLNYVEDFYKVYTLDDKWILRIYIDDSLFSKDYIYDDGTIPNLNDEDSLWENNFEDKKWKELLYEIKKHSFIQIVKYSCNKFKDPINKDYHFGYFGSVARYLSIFDEDIEVSIFRDVNKSINTRDRDSIEDFLESSYSQHSYKSNYYKPDHYIHLLSQHKKYKVNYKTRTKRSKIGVMFGGLWSSKYVDPELWDIIVEDLLCESSLDKEKVEPCYYFQKFNDEYILDTNFSHGYRFTKLAYGIDEIILNGPIYEYITKNEDSILVQPLMSPHEMIDLINNIKDVKLKNNILYLWKYKIVKSKESFLTESVGKLFNIFEDYYNSNQYFSEYSADILQNLLFESLLFYIDELIETPYFRDINDYIKNGFTDNNLTCWSELIPNVFTTVHSRNNHMKLRSFNNIDNFDNIMGFDLYVNFSKINLIIKRLYLSNEFEYFKDIYDRVQYVVLTLDLLYEKPYKIMRKIKNTLLSFTKLNNLQKVRENENNDLENTYIKNIQNNTNDLEKRINFININKYKFPILYDIFY